MGVMGDDRPSQHRSIGGVTSLDNHPRIRTKSGSSRHSQEGSIACSRDAVQPDASGEISPTALSRPLKSRSAAATTLQAAAIPSDHQPLAATSTRPIEFTGLAVAWSISVTPRSIASGQWSDDCITRSNLVKLSAIGLIGSSTVSKPFN